MIDGGDDIFDAGNICVLKNSICGCICVCIYCCKSVCIYTYACICPCICPCICAWNCACIFVCAFSWACTCSACAFVCACNFIYSCFCIWDICVAIVVISSIGGAWFVFVEGPTTEEDEQFTLIMSRSKLWTIPWILPFLF